MPDDLLLASYLVAQELHLILKACDVLVRDTVRDRVRLGRSGVQADVHPAAFVGGVELTPLYALADTRLGYSQPTRRLLDCDAVPLHPRNGLPNS